MAPAGYPTAPLGTTVKRPVRAKERPPNLKTKPPKQKYKQIKVKTPPPARKEEVTGEGARDLGGTNSSGRSNPSQPDAFLGLCFKLSRRLSHTI